MRNRVNVEFTCFNRLNHFRFQHEVINIVFGDNHSLPFGKAAPFTNFIKAFYLAGNAAHGHNVAGLAHCPGAGQGKVDRHVRQRGKQGGKFRGGGGIAFNPGVILLETKASGKYQRFVAREHADKIAFQDHDCFGVNRA